MALRWFAALAVAAAILTPNARAAELPPVKIGIIYSYTGSTANAGKAFDASIATWLQLHHDLAGGRKAVIFKRDDTGAAPDVARRLAQELVVDQHVDFLVGSIYTPNAVAIEQISAQAKIPFLIVNAGTSGILAPDPYAVRMGATIAQTTTPLGRWAAHNGDKTAYSVVSDYAPGIDSERTFTNGIVSGGGTVSGTVRVPLQAIDFSAYAQRVMDAKPQAVFGFIVAGSPAIAYFRALKNAGVSDAHIPMLVNGASVDEYDLPAMGDAPLGAISSIQYVPTLPGSVNARFVQTFRALAGYLPDFMAEAGYDSMTVIDRAIAGQTAETLDPDKSMATIRGLSIESPRGPFRIDAQTREPIQNIYLCRTVKRGGRLVNVPFETLPAIAADGSGAKRIRLTTSTGEELDVELFEPAKSALPAPGIVIAPEMYGVNAYVRDIARGWAERGYFALAIDTLWRIRRNMVLAYDGPDNKIAHDYHDAFDFPQSVPDLQAAIDALRALDGANGKVGIVGYCLGGTIAYVAAARTDVDAAVGYYGSRIVEFLGDAATIAHPLVLHFGEDDRAIPPDNRGRVIAGTAGNAAITNVVHPKAQHAFANHLRPDRYNAAAAQHADDLTSAFFRRELHRS